MKFEMNCWTVGLVDKEGLIVNKGLVERQMTLLGYRVSINTNKPDGIVQLGRDSIDLTYTDNIRASLESLVYVAKRRELMDSESVPPQMIGRALRTPERVDGKSVTMLTEGFESPERLYVQDVSQDTLDNLRSAFEARAKGSRGDLEAMSLYHCQAVKDWKTQNLGGMHTPSEDDVDELIRIVVSQLPGSTGSEGVKIQNSGYSGVTGRFWCMGSTTQNMINNHPEILRHNIKVNRILGLPIHVDETIGRGVIRLSSDDREVIFNPKQPTLNTLKSKLQEILNHAK